jgi:transcriptional regulator with XRE-family HTH domain
MKVIIDGIRYFPEQKISFKDGFGMALLMARKKLKYTLENASEEMGCSKSFLWELENEKATPSLKMASKIAKVYGIDLQLMADALED